MLITVDNFVEIKCIDTERDTDKVFVCIRLCHTTDE